MISSGTCHIYLYCFGTFKVDVMTFQKFEDSISFIHISDAIKMISYL